MINQSRGDVLKEVAKTIAFILLIIGYRSYLERVCCRLGQKCYYYVRLPQLCGTYSLGLHFLGDRKTEGFVMHLIRSCG
jgi:hypothetical protein